MFFAQVIQELRKVVSPTRKELVNYWFVVLMFVVIVMIMVGLLDFVFGKVAVWSFTR
nr:preprotein translocase subunit SecE [Pseudoglutamicibacter albus]